jgi:hypothetical protein
MVTISKVLNIGDVQEIFRKLPKEVRLNSTQFGLDLVRLVSPLSDGVGAAQSLWRGDLIAAIRTSAISLEDVKIARLDDYATTLRTLVNNVVPRDPEFYTLLTPFMTQLQSVIAKIPAGNISIEAMRDHVNRFFETKELHHISSGPQSLVGWARLAKRRGRRSPPLTIHRHVREATTDSSAIRPVQLASPTGQPIFSPALPMNQTNP